MKTIYAICATAALALSIILSSCTDNDSDTLKNDDDSGSKGNTETENYDSRFPFPVWTDDEGIMHFDIKLDDTGIYPREDVVMRNLTGNGWELDKCYYYGVQESTASGKRTYQLEENDFLYIAGGDVAPRFFFNDKTTVTIYERWCNIPDKDGNLKDDELHYSRTSATYTYTETTGVLDTHVLAHFKVIRSTGSELWLGYGKDKEPYLYEFVHYVRVTPETVAAWDEKYNE